MDRLTLAVNREARPSEKLLRGIMIALVALFLLMAVMLDRGMMLPCFLTAMAAIIYSRAIKRMYEYTLENGRLRVDRLTDFGRVTKHEIVLKDVEVLARPDDPAVARYKKGGGEKIRKYDYTSYKEGVEWYTLIAREDGEKVKLLLDLDRPAIDYIRRENRAAVKV